MYRPSLDTQLRISAIGEAAIGHFALTTSRSRRERVTHDK
jgi:hypothetical protein